MHLVLTLPGLLAQDRAVRAPCLAPLLAIAGPPSRDADGLDAMLAAHYGIVHARDSDCPLAPVRLAALGVDPGAAFWLAANPVTLVAGRDDVRLTGIARDLDAGEASALVAVLNAHFATDGIAFVAPRPDAWFVRAPANIALRTRPVATVVGRTLRDLLPTGTDAGTWRRWQSEVQMLLHEHPVNAARERDDRAPVNSVWFSEGGMLPPRSSASHVVSTFSDDGTAIALAAWANRPSFAVPATLGPALLTGGDASAIVVALSPLHDVDAVERDWATPAWTALAGGTLKTVTILADDGERALEWTAAMPGFAQRIALRFARSDLAPLLAASLERDGEDA